MATFTSFIVLFTFILATFNFFVFCYNLNLATHVFSLNVKLAPFVPVQRHFGYVGINFLSYIHIPVALNKVKGIFTPRKLGKSPRINS